MKEREGGGRRDTEIQEGRGETERGRKKERK